MSRQHFQRLAFLLKIFGAVIDATDAGNGVTQNTFSDVGADTGIGPQSSCGPAQVMQSPSNLLKLSLQSLFYLLVFGPATASPHPRARASVRPPAWFRCEWVRFPPPRAANVLDRPLNATSHDLWWTRRCSRPHGYLLWKSSWCGAPYGPPPTSEESRCCRIRDGNSHL